MKILLVSYDLNKPGKNYSALYDILKTAPYWWHYLESTWLLATNETPTQWNEKLKAAIDENDNILIVDITKRPRQGWLPTKAWEWIKEHES